MIDLIFGILIEAEKQWPVKNEPTSGFENSPSSASAGIPRQILDHASTLLTRHDLLGLLESRGFKVVRGRQNRKRRRIGNEEVR